MKKVTLMGLAGAALLCACQPTQKGTTISGTLTGVESDTLLVNILAMPPVENSPRIADTIAMQQGKFNLELQADTLPHAAPASEHLRKTYWKQGPGHEA